MEKIPKISVIPELKEVERQEIQKEALELLFNFEQEQYFIDEGGAGKVYGLPQGFCIKILDDRHNNPNSSILKLGNSVTLESAFQERMSHISFNGQTRVPRYLGNVRNDTPGGKNAIIMERLQATNVQHILNEKEPMPEGFNEDSFFNDLENFINAMHSEGITHNDLEPRNIMIDRSTGMPRVIDFGQSSDTRFIKNQAELNRVEQKDWDDMEKLYDKLTLFTK